MNKYLIFKKKEEERLSSTHTIYLITDENGFIIAEITANKKNHVSYESISFSATKSANTLISGKSCTLIKEHIVQKDTLSKLEIGFIDTYVKSYFEMAKGKSDTELVALLLKESYSWMSDKLVLELSNISDVDRRNEMISIHKHLRKAAV